MRILFLASAHNSLSQRAQIALTELGHEVDVAVVDSALQMEAAVARHHPELIVCPMLKTIIPESIFTRHRCLIVHPGPKGDRGPSSLDWAIELGAGEWGVTVLEATADVDGGDVWASRRFRTREAGKSSLYRHEVRRAAIDAVVQAVRDVASADVVPKPLDYSDPHVFGRPRPLIRQADRAIDWAADPTEKVLRRIRAAEGHPGVLDHIDGVPFHLFGGHREGALRGRPGELIAHRDGAVCRATVDGAVWITHLKAPDAFKLPAMRALELAGRAPAIPEAPAPLHGPVDGWREIAYEEHAGVGYFRARVRAFARELAAAPDLAARLEAKRRARLEDEQVRPLSTYRTAELARSPECFFGPDRSYHEARSRFVYKLGAPCEVAPALQPARAA